MPSEGWMFPVAVGYTTHGEMSQGHEAAIHGVRLEKRLKESTVL